MSKQNFEFQAEVGKILNIVANSLYSDKEIFIREYISNASDACDKLRYAQLKEPSLMNKGEKFKITVTTDKKENFIEISDNGIGMTKEDLIESLGTIAKSGTEDFIKKMEKENNKDIQQIGKFGVGFYSGFMVASKIEVLSKKAGAKDSWKWSSEGKGKFEIEKIDKKNQGTIVKIFLNNDAKEFAEKLRIENIIKKYSDHITHSVYINEKSTKDNKEEKVNQGTAIWKKEKKEISKKEYEEFYTGIGPNYDKPWKVIHNKIEGNLNYTNLIFIPTEKPFDLLNAEKKSNLKLFIKKVFITDKLENILPKYLRFVSGIIDSEDISLNISREMLQNDPIVSKIKLHLTKKILSELKVELKKSKDNYAKFWSNFGSVVKEGIHEDFTNKESILEISLFYSSKTKKLITIQEYLDNKEKEQNEIYYISGDNVDNLMNSPQMETFVKNNIEVLLFTDPVDEFWIPNITEYKKCAFKSITKGSINIDKLKNEDAKNNNAKKDSNIDKLIAYMKSHLGDKVKDVQISSRLTDSPVCFVAEENAMDIHLENLLKKHKHLDKVSTKVLEINPDHMIIKNLSKLDFKNENNKNKCAEISDLLLNQAKIIEGIPLEDSKSFCTSINNLMVKDIS
ncbi:MAG: molecular chaperone HtpG [Pelagibacterales bacterium]|nr:molecular chaperone HtpG [Pelagibacterales bacterium]OUU62929.1 MAG: molecular chaperone HtpG [Alphaproteobacteria bacterium TMED62]|tara:strand:- start:353 stop:2224 length:1872 start_codon:yes stop_codon:yes gene_type:complete